MTSHQLREKYREYEKLWDQVQESGSTGAAKALEALAEEIEYLENQESEEAA